jgi:hypothetical protein
MSLNANNVKSVQVIFVVLMTDKCKRGLQDVSKSWSGWFECAYIVDCVEGKGVIKHQFSGRMQISSCDSKALRAGGLLRKEVQRCKEWAGGERNCWFFFGSPSMSVCPLYLFHPPAMSYGVGYCHERSAALSHHRIRWCPAGLMDRVSFCYAGGGEWELTTVGCPDILTWTEERFSLEGGKDSLEPDPSLYPVVRGFSDFVKGRYHLKRTEFAKATQHLLRAFGVHWGVSAYPEEETKYACCYLLGMAFEELGESFKSVCWYLRGLDYAPTRVECCERARAIFDRENLLVASDRLRTRKLMNHNPRFFGFLSERVWTSVCAIFPGTLTVDLTCPYATLRVTSATFWAEAFYVCSEVQWRGIMDPIVDIFRVTVDYELERAVQVTLPNDTVWASIVEISAGIVKVQAEVKGAFGIFYQEILTPLKWKVNSPGLTPNTSSTKTGFVPNSLKANTPLGTIEVHTDGETQHLSGTLFKGFMQPFCFSFQGDETHVKAIAYGKERIMLFWQSKTLQGIRMSEIPLKSLQTSIMN